MFSLTANIGSFRAPTIIIRVKQGLAWVNTGESCGGLFAEPEVLGTGEWINQFITTRFRPIKEVTVTPFAQVTVTFITFNMKLKS